MPIPTTGRLVLAVAILAGHLTAKTGKIQQESLSAYVQRMQQQALDLTPATLGSLWTDNGRLVAVASDYKASRVGDIINIVVAQDVTAQNAGNVATTRTFNASSGITALGGHIGTSGVQSLFSPNSAQALAGKSQAATTSTLRTRLAGRVEAVLPGGTLIVQAERAVMMNNENQTVLVRGLVRPGDIGPDNSVASNLVGNLELELKGKGVLSEGTHPPNVVVRWLLRIVGF